ncbi:hypothetical protein C2845_PM09G13610 [Panicum miliaceum]|uniref:Uncharacterized protein n=1 Tax=Panicum miliaceum TaxID=4540 RepID=A0A3L6RZU9_PANMI|nr:hypothetical protein C2845_PM09G13610 [Panicum miliaceum]
MAPSRRNNSSLFESSTIITANLIMASSSYLLSRITPRATGPPATAAAARAPTWSSATSTRSVEPMAGCRTVLMDPVDGQDGKVDQQAETFIRRFRERTQSETARLEAAAATVWPPEPPVTFTTWAGTVHRYPQ